MTLELPLIYPITDMRLSGLSHAEQVERFAAGGATIIQLREKTLAAREFFDAASDALQVARQHGVRLIINDRVDIVRALGADGVHLGQTDLPVEAARRLLGGKAIIGYSTHNLEQARMAASLPIDYLAIGPIFMTSNKKDPDPVVGLEGLRHIREAAPLLPLVAIGGIRSENLQTVLEAGADSVAMIGDLFANPSKIRATMTNLLRIARQ
jgi:thiamine-phosphate pyrophosphorylase